MKFNDTVGIDVSKLTLDVCIHSTQLHDVFENSKKGIKQMIKWILKNSNHPIDQILFVFEHTGLYSELITDILSQEGILFTVVSGLEIKRSLGLVRGKDDKADAFNIALYGYRLRDEITPCKAPSESIKKIKKLLSLRDRFVRQRAGYKSSLKEQKAIVKHKDYKLLLDVQVKAISFLTKQISLIENELDQVLKENEELDKLPQLITSIKGIGKQTSLFLIAYTEGFTKFKSARKFASYCGVAPFPNRSGTSIRGKTKVSNLANKKIKSLLDMCAKTAIQSNLEMKIYYDRKVELGKPKMSVINVVRNKLLTRIFAVVKRQTPFVDIKKYAA
ncbi:transposase [Flavobacteriaceae bacterium F08102]|nr:transposase [Flavobacteriaceae bacterium F08102]